MPEEMIVNPKTGGRKAQKIERFDLIPWQEMREVAKVYGYGATKYADRNWERGYSWGLSLGALLRHLVLWLAGESYDPDGFHHLGAVVFHALALMRFEKTHPELDDVRSR